MTLRRKINFTLAARDLRSERFLAPVLVISGAFNLSGIMQQAIRQARGLRFSGLPWRRRISLGLQFAWAAAKRAIA